jgi:hypothetical protein
LVAIGPVVSEEKIKVYDVAKNRKKGGWNFNCPLLL